MLACDVITDALGRPNGVHYVGLKQTLQLPGLVCDEWLEASALQLQGGDLCGRVGGGASRCDMQVGRVLFTSKGQLKASVISDLSPHVIRGQ